MGRKRRLTEGRRTWCRQQPCLAARVPQCAPYPSLWSTSEDMGASEMGEDTVRHSRQPTPDVASGYRTYLENVQEDRREH